MNSEPRSTWIARRGKGRRDFRVARNWAAVVAVARLRTSSTSQRETTSWAVNCFSTTPGRGRRSRVSQCTRSPGARDIYSLGFRLGLDMIYRILQEHHGRIDVKSEVGKGARWLRRRP